jgi:VWFA-related protein
VRRARVLGSNELSEMKSKYKVCFNRRTHVSLCLLLTIALNLSVVAMQSQEIKGTKKSGADDDVVRVTSNYVNLDVMVKDKKGKSVTDLKAEDFTITENGAPQKIEFFDSTLANGNDPKQSLTVSGQPVRRTPNSFPRNIISLVLDGQTTEAVNLKHVRDGITKYVHERISDDDSVSLFAIGAGLQLLQPFTQDKEKIISAVQNAYTNSTVSKTSEVRGLSENIAAVRDQLTGLPSDPITTAAGGSAAAQAMIAQRVLEQYVQLRAALSIQQARPILAGLAAICEGLRTVPGKKTLVVFSQGFVAPQALDWQVQSTIDIANRANVSIYIIDSTGLTGGTPQSGALVPTSALSAISAATSQENRIRAGAGESVFDITRQEGLNRQQDLLYRISGDTGGQFIKNTNDIAAGMDRIDSEIRSRYTLSYRSTDPNFDGSFRKVKVAVRRSDTNVITRAGYYAIPPSQLVPLSPDDRKLMANFTTMAAHPTLPLSLELNPVRAQPGYYIVPLSFEIAPNEIKFDSTGEKHRLQLDVLGVIRRQGDDKILSRLGGNFDVGLTAQQYESILNDKIFYRQDMELEAGKYSIDLMVKDRFSGKVFARREDIDLPVADSQFFATEAVLSRHIEATKGPAQTGDVLSEGKVQIRPSPSRQFRSTDNLIIFFLLYNATPAPETGKPLVKVTVTLQKDNSPVAKPLSYELTEPLPEPVSHLTFAKYVKLAGLAPGKYSALIEITDSPQRKVLKQEAWFVIAP